MYRLPIFLVMVAALAAAQSKPQAKPATPAAAKTTAAAPAAAASPSGTKLPSEDEVNAFLQQTFGYDSSLTWRIIDIKPAPAAGLAEVNLLISSAQGQQSNKIYVTPDGTHAVIGEIIPFGSKPFAAARAELEKGINGPSRGPADASVTIVEFSDLQCPHCKEAQPVIEKLLDEEKNARFVFQNFPLPSHDWARKAALYSDCVAQASKDAIWKFVDATEEAQAEITAANADEKLTALADKAGVKGSDIAACSTRPETAARVEKSLALGKAVDVSGTPTLYINGRKVSPGGVPEDVLKKLVEFQAQQK